jgi:hypothetical protein
LIARKWLLAASAQMIVAAAEEERRIRKGEEERKIISQEWSRFHYFVRGKNDGKRDDGCQGTNTKKCTHLICI